MAKEINLIARAGPADRCAPFAHTIECENCGFFKWAGKKGAGSMTFMVVGKNKPRLGGVMQFMAKSTPDKAAFLQEPGHREFFHEMGHVMLNAGILQLMFLTVENQRAAAMWQFAFQDRMITYRAPQIDRVRRVEDMPAIER